MQTFLPYVSFAASAAVLDTRRLGKQVMECRQILAALRRGPRRDDGRPTPWFNHPAVQMWRGHEPWLVDYASACCCEWEQRTGNVRAEYPAIREAVRVDLGAPPPWLGNHDFHRGHRGHLHRKAPWSPEYWAWGADAAAPLLYPVLLDGGSFTLVERVAEGKFTAFFEPGPFAGNSRGPVRRSVRAAVEAVKPARF